MSQSGDQPKPPVEVGIGLIRRGDSYLVRMRPPGTVYAGYWEFPGGKAEPGESPADTTIRECLEETGLRIRVVRERGVVEHHYPHGHVRLHFLDCLPEDDSTESPPDASCQWVRAHDLANLRFPEANEAIVEELMREAT